MSDQDTLIFNDHDTVTNNTAAPGGFPALDGLVDLDILENTGQEPDAGYVNGAQVTFDNGSMPPILFRGIRHRTDGRLMLGFLCRINTAFHEDNAISIVMKPSFTSTNRADWRKINIYPVGSGGAEGGAGTTANDIRANRDPRDTDFFVGSGTDDWTEDTGGLPSEVRVKVRSWVHLDTGGNPSDHAWSVEVELDPTNGVGSNWMNISDDFAIFFKVVKIVNAGTGAATEYVFPLDAPDPDPTNLDDQFLESFNPTKYGRGLMDSAIPAVAEGVSFENGWQGIGRRPAGSTTTTLESWIETGPTGPGDGLDNEIVALIRNDGTSTANNISAEFRMANWGLGGPDLTSWAIASGLTPSPTAAVNVNPGAGNVALVANWPMSAVPPEYQTARHQCMWAQLSSTSSVNFVQSSVRRNMNFYELSEEKDEAEISGKGYPEPENGTGEHDFLLQTVTRRILVRNLVENPKLADPNALALARNAIIATGGVGDDNDDNPDNDEPRDDIVDRRPVTHAVTHMTRMARRGTQFDDTVIYILVSEGFRLTARTITINQNTYPVLDNRSGTFGMVGRHEGADDSFAWQFDGRNLGRYSSGMYGLKVPHNNVTRIAIVIRAENDGPAGDVSRDLPRLKEIPEQRQGGGRPGIGPGSGDDGKEKGGCLGLLFAMVAIPAALVAGIFGVGPQG
ncbi:MAG: hypothetical protein AAGK02_14770 [Pseudomonadota bacterium]